MSASAIARARAGRYRDFELGRGLPAPYRLAFFDRCSSSEWQLRPEIRQMVTLEQLNLLEPWPGMGCADVIFMRNVLVYFDIATKRALLARLRGRLHRDGVLFLGGAETPVNIDDQLVADGAAGRSRFYRVRRPD